MTRVPCPCPIGRIPNAIHHMLSFMETYSGLSGWQYICQLAVYQLIRPHHGVVMCSVFFNNGQKQLRNHLNQCAATNLYEDTCVSQGDYAYGECGWSGDDDSSFHPRTHNREMIRPLPRLHQPPRDPLPRTGFRANGYLYICRVAAPQTLI